MFENTLIIVAIIVALIILVLIALFISMYKKVPQGKALIRSGFGGVRVTFNGIFVMPFIHKKEILDITTRTITINKTGIDGLISKDGEKVDVKADFILRVIPLADEIEKIAMTIGVDKANDFEEVKNLFTNKFVESLKTASSKFEAEIIHQHLPKFKMHTIENIGRDLNGFILDDLHIYHLEKINHKNISNKN